MISLENHEFLVGIAAGKILLGALLSSSVFRNIALAASASGIFFAYYQKGLSGSWGRRIGFSPISPCSQTSPRAWCWERFSLW